MCDILTQVRDTVSRHRLFSTGDFVFAAVSGGADSMAMLHILLFLRDEWHLSGIHVLHVNHRLRSTADRDETFVREFCQQHHLPFTVKHIDVATEASTHHETVEEAGRRLRYAFFEEQAAVVPNSKIAVAHNADDHAETVLFHIIRGCGMAGLGGIPITRGTIVRPLLECFAADIRAFCTKNGYEYQEDETNTDIRYARNRIRGDIIPSMKAINPEVNRSIIRLSAIAKDEDAFLQRLAETLAKKATVSDGFDRLLLLRADAVIAKRALSMIASSACGVRLQYAQVLRLYTALKTKEAVGLPRRYTAFVDEQLLRIVPQYTELNGVSGMIVLREEEWVDFGSVLLCAHRLTAKEYLEKSKVHKNLFNFCVSYDMIPKDVHIRSRKEGDTMRPHPRGCTKFLKKLYQEWHIPPIDRRSIPVLCDKDDTVLAVLGYAVDERVAIRFDTQTVLWIEIQNKGCDIHVDA